MRYFSRYIKRIHKFAVMNRCLFFLLLQIVFSLTLLSQVNSVLSSGNWYELTTQQNGIYQLTYSDIQELGVSTSNIQISDIKLYGNGGGMLPELNSDFRYSDLIQNAIKVHDFNNNGIFEDTDYILFYGTDANVWSFNENTNLFNYHKHLYADEVSYFLTIQSQSTSKRIDAKPLVLEPNATITTYNAYLQHEEELVNLINSGRNWFGEQFNYNSQKSFSFPFPNLIQSENINIKVGVVARSFQQSSFNINVNSSLLTSLAVPAVSPDYAKEYAKEKFSEVECLVTSPTINIAVEYNSSDYGAKAWLDYIQINARRQIRLATNYLIFRDIKNIGNGIGEYKIENAGGVEVWDITEPTNVSKLITSMDGNTLSFNDSLDTLHEYIAFNSLSYKKPNLKGRIFNQDIRSTSHNVELLIVSHPDFLPAANRLSDFHLTNDNIVSEVVTPEQIYNEFSSGMQDVTAIRDFIKHQYDKDNSGLRYLLLFGDGSYDPKNRIENNTNYIPTYQSLNSTHPILSYVTDDYFGLLDEHEGLFNDDLVDIGIGRLPVATLLEANALVHKMEQYYSMSSFGSWRNDVVFIADDGDASDGNTHMWQADSLANYVADHYDEINIKKIYLDNYEQESTPGGPRSMDAQNAINNSIKKGVLLVNYTGHGGPLGWAQERILEVSQIEEWDNLYNLPLFMTATCKFSYFDNPEEKSAGEYLLLNPDGGAIALLSTTRLVYSAPNYNLNTKFIETMFEESSGNFPRLGDVFRETKVLSGTTANNRNFTLLGNPALRLGYPKFDVQTTFISDTLKALEEITIEGQLENNGILYSSFNGTIYPVVYDKERIQTTLGQESCTPMPYRNQNNILYKGAATVTDGKFSFSFIVPKDISFNYGPGKVSYYAVNDNNQMPIDANGAEKNFIIGGTSDDIIYDYDEAILSLFMNDTLFIDGGITDENPVLLAHVYDQSGVNTVGNGIGHDITAVLDGNTASPYVLNDFYEAEKDNFTRGTIRFPLYDLEEGEHSITLKVWDVFNNSSTATINFVVKAVDDLFIADFVTFPNPFSSFTDIYFQHNKVNQELDYVLEIYSITGVLVKRIERIAYNSEGYRIGPIRWDGTDNYGFRYSGGMYIAKLSVNTQEGHFSSKSTRIILLP